MAMPVGTSARPPPAATTASSRAWRSSPASPGVGVGRQRAGRGRAARWARGATSGPRSATEAGARAGHRARPDATDGASVASARDGAPAVGRCPRPLAGRVGPAPPAARRRRPAGDRRRRRRRRAGPGRGAAAHAADARRQRHRRAAAHQPRPGARSPTTRTPGPCRVELDLATGERGSRQRGVGALFARLCGAEAAMVVNNNAAAVLLVLAALAAGRDVPVSRGESVEIGGGFRVPEVMEQSGARLVDVGTTNRTRLADYRRAVDRRRRGARAQGAPEQLPRRRVRRGDVDGRAGHARACRSSSTSAAGCSTRRARGWPGAPAGVAGRRAGGPPDARRRRRARDVQRRQAARRPAGRDHRRPAPTSSSAAPATRWPGPCGRAASCSPRCRTSPSPTSGATS